MSGKLVAIATAIYCICVLVSSFSIDRYSSTIFPRLNYPARRPFGHVFARSDEDTDDAISIADLKAINKIANLHVVDVYNPITMTNFEDYKAEYRASITEADKYWGEKAKNLLDWFVEPTSISNGGFEKGDVRWFEGGKLNVCYNAIDRHVLKTPKRVALRFEGDEPGDVNSYTYEETLSKVCQISNALKSKGVRKGDVVTIYMPMIPELPMTMLACARIGAVHSVVFAGFSSDALAARIEASSSRFVITADQGVRGGRKIPLKNTVNAALDSLPDEDLVKAVFVYERFFDEFQEKASYEMRPKDVRMNVLLNSQRPYCPCEIMDAEDDLFILYTSGSTGKPKGLVHTTAGYSLYTMYTSKLVFDLRPETVYACVADCGWITGHSYIAYGPLLNGCATFVFESTPLYPDAGRYWDLVQRHKINVFYTSPTAIRSVKRYGDEIPKKYDLSSLRILGTVGEPINPEAWRWYFENIGLRKCTVVDTYWQTETGGVMISNLPGAIPMKPGSCTLPFFGVDAVVLDQRTGEELVGNDVEGVLAIRQPWPGMARTNLGDHERYLKVYMQPYPGYYCTGDAVKRDEDGYIFIIGRIDDVINVSGHRIGTAEIESALVAHPAVSQAAVIGMPHDIKGQAICCFTMLTVGYEDEIVEDQLIQDLRTVVRKTIGPFASPDVICLCQNLPTTRSGKIMRRILRKIASDEMDTLGDISTLSDPSVVEDLYKRFALALKAQVPVHSPQGNK